MKHQRTSILVYVTIVVLIALSACNFAPAVTPTPDQQKTLDSLANQRFTETAQVQEATLNQAATATTAVQSTVNVGLSPTQTATAQVSVNVSTKQETFVAIQETLMLVMWMDIDNEWCNPMFNGLYSTKLIMQLMSVICPSRSQNAIQIPEEARAVLINKMMSSPNKAAILKSTEEIVATDGLIACHF